MFTQLAFVCTVELYDSDSHLIVCQVDLIQLREDLEGGPCQTGEQVAREQQNLEQRNLKNKFAVVSLFHKFGAEGDGRYYKKTEKKSFFFSNIKPNLR